MNTPVYDWIAHHATYAPDSPAITDVASGRALSYAQFDARIDRLAHHLRHRVGIQRGDRLSILAANASEHFELLFACRRLGAIFVPLNWRLALPELRFIVADAAPACLLVGEDFAEVGQALAQSAPGLALLPLRYGAPSAYEDAIAQAPRLGVAEPLGFDDPWTILYTSGTTGRPKGAITTHGTAFFSSVNAIQKMQITASSCGLTFMPLFHAGGLYLFALWIFHFGGSNLVMRSFDAALALALLADRQRGISHLLGVPTQFIMISELPDFAEADLSHVQSVTIGGAAAPVPLLEKYLRKGIVLQQGWGMTETAAMATVLSKPEARKRIGSCGLPVLHTRLRVVDVDGQDVPPGATGELLIKGPTVTPGYWNRPEESARAFVDGWLRTGDAVRMDEDGYLYVVDRIKDMYISGGENVYPLEVENVLHGLPQVLEAAVVGIPDPKWGEVGRAFIVLRRPDSLSEAEVLAHCNANLARFKVPRSIRFLAELPHNASGKLVKHMLPRD
ncbi:acyl-CoA synthetase [Pseudorhodoferax sp.]|uniref:acyl-CoA synthetase n=1 Tax=Pseudorhodoferax sp. TaxID=1993553 RepID=UPI002DD61F93|nr:long-chain fatty acid--CoA ligase [Pseudorhodoferax sp.]